MKIKKGDLVQVITGKDKGKQGKVVQAFPADNRVLVEGVNRVKKHTKAEPDRPRFQDRRHRHDRGPPST
ncbi:hypothetical protein GCM10020000_45340 [Streptomyces olivoverticillatus]